MSAKQDREKRNQCWWSGCACFQVRCKVYHGNYCKRLGGDKIPSMRLINPEKWTDKRPRRIKPPATKFKPYFLSYGPNILDEDGGQLGSSTA